MIEYHLTDTADDVSTALESATRTVIAGPDLRTGPLLHQATEDLLTGGLKLTPWASWASITHRPAPNRAASTLAASGARAAALDRVQYALEQGPSLDALTWPPAAGVEVGVRVGDLGSDERWPELAEQVRRADLAARSVISTPLIVVPDQQAVLTLYGATEIDLQAADVAAGVRLAAAVIGVGLAALMYRRKVDNLSQALDSSRQIGAALGILITRHQWTYDDAFDKMRSYSQQMHRKLRDLADEVIMTGALPAPHDVAV